MPRGYEHNQLSVYEHNSGHFFLKFSQNKIVMGKKILVPFPKKYTVKDHISNTTGVVHVQRIVLMPPGHPKIFLKSN